jgi:enhancer of mRNA-decapping protein 3
VNPGGRRLARENVRINSRPVALFLVGNHRAGARALAAARHLRNRSVKTVACILGSERPGLELDREVKKQADMLSKLGTVVRSWPEVRTYLGHLDSNGQPELVVEALLAPTKGYDGLSVDDQRTVVEMVSWMNRSAGRVVVSVDAPSGINGSTGEASLLSDSSTSIDPVLEVKAKHIVCVGAPRLGLLRALLKVHAGATSNTNPLGWQIWVADIGVNRAWKECGLGGTQGVRFGAEWVSQVKFVDAVEDGANG